MKIEIQVDESRKEIIEFIDNLATNDKLSFRDLYTLLTNYQIMISTFLRKYTSINAHMLYLFLLLMKYKHNDVYDMLLSDKSVATASYQKLIDELGNTIDNRTITFKLQLLMIKENINEMEFSIIDSSAVDYKNDGARAMIASIRPVIVNGAEYIHIDWRDSTRGIRRIQSYQYTCNESLDLILYYQDLLKWEEIKYLTLSQYYHQQLEMFNFSLPSTENPPEA